MHDFGQTILDSRGVDRCVADDCVLPTDVSARVHEPIAGDAYQRPALEARIADAETDLDITLAKG